MGYDGSLKFDTAIDEKGFSSGITKLGSITKSGLTVLAGAVGGISMAMGAGVAAAVKVGASFEAEMSKVSAISGAVGDDLDALTEKAKEMGAKTKFSASESAQAMEYMAMAGWKTGDMLGGIEGIMNLAAASGENLAVTSDIVTDALTAFGMSASDSGRFADVLAAASSNANTNVAMMGETFKYVAPVAGALGYSIEDCSVAIGLMANSGIKAGIAGTSLRALLTNLAKPTDAVDTAMTQLGISLTDSSGKMKGMDSLIGDLRTSFSGLSESQKAQYAATLAGQEGMSGLLAIVNSSNEDFNKLKDAIYNANGAAEKMAATMQDNLQGQLTILKSSAEGLGIEIYESIQKPLTGLSKAGVDALNQLTTAFQENGTEGLIEAGGKIVGNLLAGIASAIPGVIDTSVQVIQSIVENINANIPQFLSAGTQILSSLIGGIMQVIPTLGQTALTIINTLLNGIVAADVFIAKGAEIIQKLISGISGQIPALIPLALETVLSMADGIVDNLPVLAEAGLDMLVSIAEGVANALPTLIEKVPVIINKFCSKLDSFIPKILATGVKIIVTLGKGVINAIPTIIANAGEIVKAILNVITHFSLFSQGSKLIKGMGNGIKSVFGNINGIIKNLIDIIKNPFKVDWSGIGKNIVNGIANGLKNGVGAVVNAAKSVAKGALNAAKNFLGIHSPSTVFRDQVGKYMAKGIGVGFADNLPVSDMEEKLEQSVGRMRNAAGSVTAKRSVVSNVVNNTYNDYEPVRDTKVTQNINIHQPVKSPVETARAIKRAGKELAYA